MAGLVTRRLILMVPILVIVSIALFGWVRALPGSPADALLGDNASPAARAQFEHLYGLDQPVPAQYAKWLGHAVKLDFGTSTQTQRSVLAEFRTRFPATAELALLALLIAVAVAVPAGYVAASRAGGWLDRALVTSSVVGVAIPVFFLAFLLKYLFAVRLGWLPASGRASAYVDAAHPTGFYVLDGVVAGDPAATLDALKHLLLPALALSSIPLAMITRITRSAVVETLQADYVRTGRSKGLSRHRLRTRYVLKNALLPVITAVGLMAGLLLSGAVLTETVFAFPGVGRFMYDAIEHRDYAVIEGFTLLIAAMYILVNAAVDIAYGIVDPRVRVA